MEAPAAVTFSVRSIPVPPAGRFPNNPKLPLLAYRPSAGEGALPASGEELARFFEETFSRRGWPAAWRNGVYGFHHYHSTAHEALGIYGGSARVRFGGEDGVVLEIRAGDAVVIPAGVSHKLEESDGNLRVVGAYPAGQIPDLLRGGAGETAAAAERAANVPPPEGDPLMGPGGPLAALWFLHPSR
jgi:uncharacterized protein YjlB